MKRCPITYEALYDDAVYSLHGLKLLSPKLTVLHPLELDADEQRKEALSRVGKMSIQGVQKKLSARLKPKAGCFEIVDKNGHYILKPQSELYPELPENEALSMTLAQTIGLEVPVHGLVYSKDQSMTYFVKRFDRFGHHKKLALEDFAQLSQADRHTKYNSSMEKVIGIIENFCTFPKIEFVKLFKLTLFNFLIGNEDMHLKNFSLIIKDKKVMLSPAYDLLNSTIAQKNAQEELALSLKGKKHNLTKRDFLEYFAVERLGLNHTIMTEILKTFQQAKPKWEELISVSFLSQDMQKKYLRLLQDRYARLDL